MRSRILLAIGFLGAAYVAAGLLLWYRVVTGPGDDNPVALLGVVTAAFGAVPAWGLVLWHRRRPLRAHRVWLTLASIALATLGALTAFLLPLFGAGR